MQASHPSAPAYTPRTNPASTSSSSAGTPAAPPVPPLAHSALPPPAVLTSGPPPHASLAQYSLAPAAPTAMRPDLKGKRKASSLDSADDFDVLDGEGELSAAAAVLGGAAAAAAAKKDSKKKVKVGARASIACKTCRKRKVRCSAEWPVCQFCAARKLECVYEGHPAENGGSLYAGPSGIVAANGTALDAELPPLELILEALDLFFKHYYDTFPFFHRPSLKEDIEEGRAPREVIYCILALASRFSPALRDAYDGSAPSAAEHYANLAALLLSTPDTPPGQPAPPASADMPISLMRCQCHLVLGFYELTAGRDNSGWLKIGTSIRMAQVLRLGFDDEVPVYETAHNPTSIRGRAHASAAEPVLAEIRRRTFWALFSLDRTISDGNERPCGLKVPRIASLRMPGPDSDFVAGRKSVGARFDPDPPAWSVSTKVGGVQRGGGGGGGGGDGATTNGTSTPTATGASSVAGGEGEAEADLYGFQLRIAEIWSKVASYIGSGGRNVDRRPPWLAESTFAQLARELTEFEERLPDVLKYSTQTLIAHCMVPEDAKLFALLHLTNAMARHVLHRDYLPFLPPLDFKAANGPIDGEPLYGDADAPSGWWQESFDVAARSANIISDVCTHLASHGIVMVHPFCGFAAVAAGTVHCHIRYWPQSSSVEIDAAHYLNQDAEILNGLRQIYPIAARWYESLAGLQLLYFNLARGVLDADPFKVRARVLQLLRSAKDEAEEGTPTRESRPSKSAKNGSASHAVKKQKAAANGSAATSPDEAEAVTPSRPHTLAHEDSTLSVSSSVGPSATLAAGPSVSGETHLRTISQTLSELVNSPLPSHALDSPAGYPPLFPSHLQHHAHPHAHAHLPQHAHGFPAHPLDATSFATLAPELLPGDFSFDLASVTTGSLGGLGGLGLGGLDDWGAGYYLGAGSSWGLPGFGGYPHGAPPFSGAGGGDLGWGGM
ncbi:uncharacterized protein JCM10292_007542 [Rhodotorula paludigena]|uniref:uncharacterized protein n=1 Tax=Rhodotorula paludigena TaxID=86838 RepID=UPI00316FA23D